MTLPLSVLMRKRCCMQGAFGSKRWPYCPTWSMSSPSTKLVFLAWDPLDPPLKEPNGDVATGSCVRQASVLLHVQSGHVELVSSPGAAGSRYHAPLTDGRITVAPQLSDAELLQVMEPHADVDVRYSSSPCPVPACDATCTAVCMQQCCCSEAWTCRAKRHGNLSALQ